MFDFYLFLIELEIVILKIFYYIFFFIKKYLYFIFRYIKIVIVEI